MGDLAATPEEVRTMQHMLGASTDRKPLGWRDYGAWPVKSNTHLSMIDRGLIVKTGERDGLVYTRVSDDWKSVLVHPWGQDCKEHGQPLRNRVCWKCDQDGDW